MISYIGGKSQIGTWIRDYIPNDIETYVETFGGMFWVFFRMDDTKYPNLKNVVYNDFNPLNYNLFKNVRGSNYESFGKLLLEEDCQGYKDEYDSTNHVEKKLNSTTFNFSARLEVDYINQKYGLSLPETEFYETIGGLVAYNTGEIPKKGEQIEISPYTLTIKKVSATKIEEVIITEINEI